MLLRFFLSLCVFHIRINCSALPVLNCVFSYPFKDVVRYVYIYLSVCLFTYKSEDVTKYFNSYI